MLLYAQIVFAVLFPAACLIYGLYRDSMLTSERQDIARIEAGWRVTDWDLDDADDTYTRLHQDHVTPLATDAALDIPIAWPWARPQEIRRHDVGIPWMDIRLKLLRERGELDEFYAVVQRSFSTAERAALSTTAEVVRA